MDKGIRPETIRKFNELLPTRENSTKGNTAFRKSVMGHVMEQFKITVASAATHYNHAFIEARKKAETDAELAKMLVGLGRPEDKKGGRKKKAAAPTTPAATTDAGATSDVLGSNILGNSEQAETTPAATISTEAALVGLEGLQQAGEEQPQGGEQPQGEVQAETPAKTYSVKKVADGSIVCDGLTLEEANELIEKAKQAKKGKLELVA